MSSRALRLLPGTCALALIAACSSQARQPTAPTVLETGGGLQTGPRIETPIGGLEHLRSEPEVNTLGLTRFMRDYIEAIYLGSGPLIPRDRATACPWSLPSKAFAGWSRGTRVRVIVSTTASAEVRDNVRAVVNQIRQATNGTVTATYEITSARDPRPRTDQVTMTLHPHPERTGCLSPWGCIHHGWRSPALFLTGRSVVDKTVPPRGWAHELGHGIMGMCHVDGQRIGGAAKSLMSGGPGVFSADISRTLSAYDLAAASAVYRAGMRPGARRSDFLRAGLVNKPTTRLGADDVLATGSDLLDDDVIGTGSDLPDGNSFTQ